MWERIKKAFSPPVFEGDEEKTRNAGMLNAILIIVVFLLILFCVAALVTTPDLMRILIELSLGALAVVMLIILRRGHVRLAGYMFTFKIWALVSLGTYVTGGFRGSVMSAYFGIILIAELLLGTWAGVVFGGLSIAVTGFFLYADLHGLIPAPAAYATLTIFWVEFSITVIGVVALITLVINSLHRALERTRLNEKELAFKIQEIQLLAQQATEANNFKSNLISRVSHELRTPLGAILGMTEMLYVSSQDTFSDQQKKIALRIVENSKFLERIITELLEQSRIESNQLKINEGPFSPARILEQIKASFESQARRKGLTLYAEIEAGLPDTMLGDAGRLEQVVSNLVGNAIKFTKIGAVHIFFCNVNEKQWAIQVSDTGIGISEEAKTYIFDPFRQVDQRASREYGGVGLGLSIVKQLVVAMGGTITLKSEPGQGSTFMVSLPIRLPGATESIEKKESL